LAGIVLSFNLAKMREKPLAMLAGNYSLNRRQVAAHLGVSVSTIRRREHVDLHPVYDEQGVWRFDPAELEGMLVRPSVAKTKAKAKALKTFPRRDGELAAKVFRMFERGAGLSEIVQVLKVTPKVVRRLHRDWMSGLGSGQKAAEPSPRQG